MHFDKIQKDQRMGTRILWYRKHYWLRAEQGNYQNNKRFSKEKWKLYGKEQNQKLKKAKDNNFSLNFFNQENNMGRM